MWIHLTQIFVGGQIAAGSFVGATQADNGDKWKNHLNSNLDNASALPLDLVGTNLAKTRQL